MKRLYIWFENYRMFDLWLYNHLKAGGMMSDPFYVEIVQDGKFYDGLLDVLESHKVA